MKPDDPRALLELYKDAASPGEIALRRAFNATMNRIAAGDPGLPISADAAAGPARPAVPRALAAGGAVALTTAAAVLGLSWWSSRAPSPPTAPAGPPGTGTAREPGERSAPAAGGAGGAGGAGAREAARPGAAGAARCRALAGSYVRPDDLREDPPAEDWRHPWRAYLETRPARAFLDGVGAHLNLGPGRATPAHVELLARHGVRVLHVEVSWGHVEHDDETRLRSADRLAAVLAAARRLGVRPILRVFSNDADPCPLARGRRRLAAPARAGDRALALDHARGLVAGRSGMSQVTSARAAEILFSAVEGDTVTLAKPLPWDLPAGATVSVATLKYRPFAAPGSASFDETLSGWLRFVDLVAEHAARALGTAGAADLGFDLEIGQPFSFTSSFLALGRYGDAWPDAQDLPRAARAILAGTAAHVAVHPRRYRGVRLVDGFFANDLDVPCAAGPPGVSGLARRTPGALRRLWSPLDPTADAASFAPVPAGSRDLTLAFPELEATALGPRGFARDLAPVGIAGPGGIHGRAGRGPGRPSCDVWLVGPGIDPRLFAPALSEDRAAAVAAKIAARQYAFFLHKGAAAVAIHAFSRRKAYAGQGPGLLAEAEGAGARAAGPLPALAALGRMARILGGGLDDPPGAPARLELRALADCHGHAQAPARGGRPALANRDHFVFLPFQVSARRFAIVYYVMTLDTSADLPPERYEVSIGGLPGALVGASAREAVRDGAVSVEVLARAPDEATLALEATDAPRLLVLEVEGPPAP